MTPSSEFSGTVFSAFLKHFCLRLEAEECHLESVIEFPIEVNASIVEIEHGYSPDQTQPIQYHMGKDAVPIPVFCANSTPFDVKHALANTIRCPVRYLSKAPPSVVTENFCFVVDGDIVSFDAISRESNVWWNDTGTATRYYSTDSLKTFYQVTMLMSRGSLRSAYRTRANGGGMEQVPLNRVFRVARYFSYWKSCRHFHRIISLVAPVSSDGIKECGFTERIFIQYLWRTDSKSDKERVALEYASAASTSSALGARRRRELWQAALRRRRSIDVAPPVPTFIGGSRPPTSPLGPIHNDKN